MEVDDITVGQNISVKVEEYLSDLILVSFAYKSKLFQGILLDATKRCLPCGIYSKNIKQSDETEDPSLDKLFSVKQRFSYFQYNHSNESKALPLSLKKSIGNKSRNSRMTVRLRPRQVLCSNCQSICNENSEKVRANIKISKNEIEHRNYMRSKNLLNNNNNNNNNNIFNINKNNVNYRESRSSRETRQTVGVIKGIGILTNNDSCSPNSLRSTSSSPVLVPKLIKLKASDIENATSSLPLQNDASSLKNESLDENKLPKLKLISGLSSKRTKAKYLRMPSSTSKLFSGEINKECSIRTRSRGSVDDPIHEQNILNINYDSGNMLTESMKSGFSTEFAAANIKEYKADISDTNTKSLQTSDIPDEEDTATHNLELPKLTILAMNSKPIECELNQKLDKPEKLKLLRKKRPIESTKESWEEIVSSENKKPKCHDKETSPITTSEDDGNVDSDKPKQTPVLKISFGPGKGTVLKIPAKSTVSENDSTESEDRGETDKTNKTKAARKALKKAKKEAQKKALVGSTSVFANKSRFGGKSPIRINTLSPARLTGFSPGRFGNSSPGRFGGASPGRFGGASPGRFGGASPGRFGGMSPGRFGNGSPARFAGSSHSLFGGMMTPRGYVESFLRTQTRKHKHKVKHKKRHKEERKHKSDENIEPAGSPNESLITKEENEPLTETTNMDTHIDKNSESIRKVPNSPDQIMSNSPSCASPKHNFLQLPRHKLSISIKRVNNASYVTCDPNVDAAGKSDLDSDSLQLSTEIDSKYLLSSTDDSRTKVSIENCDALNMKSSYVENDFNYLNISSENDCGREPNQSSSEICGVPNFPWTASGTAEINENATLQWLKLTWHDIENFEVAGSLFTLGDIVWAKIDDFPWWPAKIVRLKESNECCKVHQAQVCWYGTTSSSLLPIENLQPFLKKYDAKYNKEKQGPYQDAVKEANFDAEQIAKDSERAFNLSESPITASPREVNVLS